MNNSEELFFKHRICEDCFYYLGKWNEKHTMCPNCQSHNINGCFVEYNLKNAILKDCFELRNLADLLDEQRKIDESLGEDVISDVTSGIRCKELRKIFLKAQMMFFCCGIPMDFQWLTVRLLKYGLYRLKLLTSQKNIVGIIIYCAGFIMASKNLA